MIVVQIDPVRVIGEVTNPENFNKYEYIKVESVPTKEYDVPESIAPITNEVIPATTRIGYVEDIYLEIVGGAVVEMTLEGKAAVDLAAENLVNTQNANLNDRTGQPLMLRTDYTQSCDDALENGRVIVEGRRLYGIWRQIVYEAMQAETVVNWDTILAAEPSPKAVA